MKLFCERLKIAINVESVNAFAKRSGIPEGTLRTYLSGASLPGLDKLIAISDAAQVNIEWLATGKGPMKPSTDDTPRYYDEDFLQAVIETSESYWIREGKNLSPSEKADIITSVYAIMYEPNLSIEASEIEDVIKRSEIFDTTFDTMMSMAVEKMLDPVSGKKSRKRFEKHLKRMFKGAFNSKEKLEFFIDELIGSCVLRKHMKDGTLKFPVMGEDGTIQSVNFKDWEAAKEPKNQNHQ